MFSFSLTKFQNVNTIMSSDTDGSGFADINRQFRKQIANHQNDDGGITVHVRPAGSGSLS